MGYQFRMTGRRDARCWSWGQGKSLRPSDPEKRGPQTQASGVFRAKDVPAQSPYSPLPDHTRYLEPQNGPQPASPALSLKDGVAETDGCGQSGTLWTQVSSCVFLAYLALKVETGLREKGTRL